MIEIPFTHYKLYINTTQYWTQTSSVTFKTTNLSYSCTEKLQIAKGWELFVAEQKREKSIVMRVEERWMNGGRREREGGMEWDRKWKAVSSFTPCDLISVIMGFMSFPSRRPHTTSHVPGHTHLYFIHWLKDKRTVHVFLSLWLFIFPHSLHQHFTYLITH